METVLINAYAVSPTRGSEPGMGWNWIVHIAEFFEVHVITEEEFRQDIELALRTVPNGDRMHFYYIPVSERVRQMCRNQGDWRFYIYYRFWQRKALRLARRICQKQSVSIIHQLNMVGFREPGYLWKVPDVKFIWGPIGGMSDTPVAFFRDAPVGVRLKIVLKNILNRIQTFHSYRVRRAIQRADAVICATADEQRIVRERYGKDAVIIPETGFQAVTEARRHSWDEGPFRLLWVGSFMWRKQLGLALRVLSRLSDIDVELHVVGSGNLAEEADNHALSRRLGVEDRVVWHGQVPHEDVLALMDEANLFLFTSVHEATSTVILEAISRSLPIVCFDTCGFGPIVDTSIGRKIAVTTPAQAVEDFAARIRKLYGDPDLLRSLSDHCRGKGEELSWKGKMDILRQLYEI